MHLIPRMISVKPFPIDRAVEHCLQSFMSRGFCGFLIRLAHSVRGAIASSDSLHIRL